VIQMRSMLVGSSGERQLVELKAVDAQWPLVGAATLEPAQPLAEALQEREQHYGLLAEQVVLDRLGLHPGDTARLGTATFRVAGALTHEPDRVATASILGPRVLIPAAALPSTGLISPGAMVRYAIRLTASDPTRMALISAGSSPTRVGEFAIPAMLRRASGGSSTRRRCS
jgi:putative ABC transport system permease protein